MLNTKVGRHMDEPEKKKEGDKKKPDAS